MKNLLHLEMKYLPKSNMYTQNCHTSIWKELHVPNHHVWCVKSGGVHLPQRIERTFLPFYGSSGEQYSMRQAFVKRGEAMIWRLLGSLQCNVCLPFLSFMLSDSQRCSIHHCAVIFIFRAQYNTCYLAYMYSNIYAKYVKRDVSILCK